MDTAADKGTPAAQTLAAYATSLSSALQTVRDPGTLEFNR
jgi:hypothetical protein